MSPGLTALAVAVVAGGVIAVATRDARSTIIATTLVAVGSPILAGTLLLPLALAARLVSALLAAYLLWVAVRGQPATAGSPIGWPAEALVACAAGVAGFAGAMAASGALAGPPEATAAGIALLVAAAAPLFVGRDALRMTIGALLAAQGASLIGAGFAGAPASMDQLALAVLVATLGAVGAALIVRAREGSGGLELGARRPFGARATQSPGTAPGPAGAPGIGRHLGPRP